MPKRTAKQSIVVVREDGRKIVAPGEVFDFTDEELSHLDDAAVSKVVTTVVEEGADGDQKAQAKPAKAAKGAKSTEADL